MLSGGKELSPDEGEFGLNSQQQIEIRRIGAGAGQVVGQRHRHRPRNPPDLQGERWVGGRCSLRWGGVGGEGKGGSIRLENCMMNVIVYIWGRAGERP